MATLLFAAAGQAIGGAIGGGILGVGSAAIGQAIGATLGRVVDAKLMSGRGGTRREGPRLESLDVMTSDEGAPLLDIAGRCAVAGEVIWAARLEERASVETDTVGSGKQASEVETDTYSYFASFAVSLGEGPLRHYGRIWMDGKPFDPGEMIAAGRLRFYRGGEDQPVDPLIDMIEGGTPAYQGTAYLVFESLPLAAFGNRPPQVKVEVWGRAGAMEELVRGACVIPASTEWGYEPTVVTESSGPERVENGARSATRSDWTVSMDMHDAILRQSKTVSLVVAWFGTDLRAGQCRVEPRVEFRDKVTSIDWRAGTLDRATAAEVSRVAPGRPAYGSSPADASVVAAIADLRARGHRTVLYPFVMMDVRADMALPAPDGVGVQPDYPWRGRITPTAGADVAAEVAAFMGDAQRSDFAIVDGAVVYSGPPEFAFRRFILHLAHVAAIAGGVDAFLVGTEMRGLSMSRGAGTSFPFVDALRTLAADVRAILPTAKISYAADWSEYHSVRDGDEVLFHLDPLWSDAAIDFVGIDNYLPLSDWRPGTKHADHDAAAGRTAPYDLDYLKDNVEGGEYWDWFYADDDARAAQVRTPIADGAHGETWVYRQKAIRDWHGNAHHNRPGGVRQATPTAWSPAAKPFWFTELGCPAVEFGANQPNVFYSPLSSEAAFPHFSSGTRDDFMQRQFLRAVLEWWRDNGAGVLDIDDVQIWCWDARPWPEFPGSEATWSDAGDWYLGHWLNGRAGAAPAAEALQRRLLAHGVDPAAFDVARAWGQVDGYPATSPMALRDYAQPLEVALGLQSAEIEGRLTINAASAARRVPPVGPDAMVDAAAAPLATLERSAIEDVPTRAIFRFRDGSRNYETAAALVIATAAGVDVAEASSPLVMGFDAGNTAADRLLRSAIVTRETVSFGLPRSRDDVRVGSLVEVTTPGGRVLDVMVTRVTDGTFLAIEAAAFDPAALLSAAPVSRPRTARPIRGATAADLLALDLPRLPGASLSSPGAFVGATARPWPGRVVVARAPTESGTYRTVANVNAPATVGATLMPLDPALGGLWTDGPLDLSAPTGAFVTRPDADVLEGANAVALRHPGGWEVVQFRGAELIDGGWRLSGLLRGQAGTEFLAASALDVGAQVVTLDRALRPVDLAGVPLGAPAWFRFGPAAVDRADHRRREITFTGAALRPYAPAHLAAADVAGGVRFDWVRRSRAGSDGFWETGVEPPLAEASEIYVVQIVPRPGPSAVARSATVTSPTWTYDDTARTADGLAGAPYRLRVAQVSDTYGRGTFATFDID